MRRAHIPLLALTALTAVTAACEGGAPWDDDESPGDIESVHDFGPTAAYDRRLVFLGPGDDLPTAAVFDFVSRSDSAEVRRGARARVVDGEEWINLMDAGWRMAGMRDPWRLVPHGPLKMVVTDAGELASLAVRDEERDVRLDIGPPLAEHSPDAGTQLVLRQATVSFGDRAVNGLLLDAQLGRSITPDAPDRRSTGPDSFPPEAGTEAAPETGSEAAPDTAAPPVDSAAVDTTADPTPAALPGAEALLLDNAGYQVVFAGAADGDVAWVHHAGRDDVFRGARLEPSSWETFEEGGVEMATAWRVVYSGEELAGEVVLEAADLTPLSGSDLSALGYTLVSGWIEDRGARRPVFGLVRHVR